mmetsp:Transcript_8700/g.18573  ORF Transcript_8700/g.18573 Transcript_8700/m.18573 type:complete len:200 (-) Transcript_8700:1424-2023(-)
MGTNRSEREFPSARSNGWDHRRSRLERGPRRILGRETRSPSFARPRRSRESLVDTRQEDGFVIASRTGAAAIEGGWSRPPRSSFTARRSPRGTLPGIPSPGTRQRERRRFPRLVCLLRGNASRSHRRGCSCRCCQCGVSAGRRLEVRVRHGNFDVVGAVPSFGVAERREKWRISHCPNGTRRNNCWRRTYHPRRNVLDE